ANMKIGLAQDEIVRRGWAVTAQEAMHLIGLSEVALIGLRERTERARHGEIAGSMHVPDPSLHWYLRSGGILYEMAQSTGERLLFDWADGERSAMAVQAAQEAGLTASCHIDGGLDAWKKAGGQLAH